MERIGKSKVISGNDKATPHFSKLLTKHKDFIEKNKYFKEVTEGMLRYRKGLTLAIRTFQKYTPKLEASAKKPSEILTLLSSTTTLRRTR